MPIAPAVALDEPAPANRAVTEPPPLLAAPAPPAATVAVHAEAPGAGIDARWAITLAGGRTADGFCLRTTCGGGPWVSFDNGYQIELQHQHIEPTGLEAGLESDFASAMVGIRLRLP